VCPHYKLNPHECSQPSPKYLFNAKVKFVIDMTELSLPGARKALGLFNKIAASSWPPMSTLFALTYGMVWESLTLHFFLTTPFV
jgi:hypothetical protein